MLTTKDVARELHTDQKTARRFLRSILPRHQGRRWEVPEESLDTIKLLFLLKRLGKEDMLKLLVKSP